MYVYMILLCSLGGSECAMSLHICGQAGSQAPVPLLRAFAECWPTVTPFVPVSPPTVSQMSISAIRHAISLDNRDNRDNKDNKDNKDNTDSQRSRQITLMICVHDMCT